MAVDLDEQKKAILPFMQRAQEIQQADPKVAYYCRMYAIEQALKFPQRAKEINSLLVATMGQLERDKARLELDPAADRIHCLGFALRIFDNADRVDRAGKATERTSKAFYAASVFIEILNHFDGGVDGELLEKQRYCAWRAAEIRKALREGRQPLPPPAPEAPATDDLPAAAGSGPAGPSAHSAVSLADLPPASGSSDWAYSGSGRSQAQPSGGGVGPASAASFSSYGAASFSSPPLPPLHFRAPPPSMSVSFAAAAAPSTSAAAAAAVAAAAPSTGSGARFWPGAKMLIRTEEGLEEGSAGGGGGPGEHSEVHVATVGQVLQRPDGGVSYKVALTNRLVEVPDEAAVPALEEGDTASLLRHPVSGAQQLSAVKVLLINRASWPPTFLIQTAEGKEHAVTADQLAPQPREGVTSAAPPPPPPPPPQAPDFFTGPGSGTPWGGAPAAPPPRPPPHPHAPLHPPPPSSPPRAPPAPFPPSPPPPPQQPYPTVSGAPCAPPPPAQPPSYPTHSYSGPAAPAPAAAAQSWAAPAPAPVPGYKPPLQVITDAQKQAKYAVSALSFEDIGTAVKHLTEALRLLTNPAAATAPARR